MSYFPPAIGSDQKEVGAKTAKVGPVDGQKDFAAYFANILSQRHTYSSKANGLAPDSLCSSLSGEHEDGERLEHEDGDALESHSPRRC